MLQRKLVRSWPDITVIKVWSCDEQCERSQRTSSKQMLSWQALKRIFILLVWIDPCHAHTNFKKILWTVRWWRTNIRWEGVRPCSCCATGARRYLVSASGSCRLQHPAQAQDGGKYSDFVLNFPIPFTVKPCHWNCENANIGHYGSNNLCAHLIFLDLVSCI